MTSATSTPRTRRLRRAVAVLAVVAAALSAAPAAQARITDRDLPTAAQVAAAIPGAAGIEMRNDRLGGLLAPARRCGTVRGPKQGTGRGTSGYLTTGLSVSVAVYDLGSAAKAKGRYREFRTAFSRCRTYPDPNNDATVTEQPFRVRRVGQAAVGYVMTTTFSDGRVSHRVAVLVRSGDRLGATEVSDGAQVPRTPVVRLARVMARTMR